MERQQRQENQIITIPIRSVGQGRSSLTLTDRRVIGRFDRGFLGNAETTIPVQAVDSVFNGWRRRPILAWIAAGLLLVAIVVEDTRIVGLLMAVVFAVLFWILRPAQILVRSGREAVGGAPESVDDAERFVDALTHLLVTGPPSVA